jgi:hypothetical protein
MTLPRPQRIIHPSPPGSLLKRLGDRPAAAPRKDDNDRDVSYLANVRLCPCLKCGMEPSEAAHVRMASAAHGKASGMGKQPADRWALPLCSGCHRDARDAQHKRSEAAFWHDLGINAPLTCERLHTQRDDLVAMRAVVFVAIAKRSKR